MLARPRLMAVVSASLIVAAACSSEPPKQPTRPSAPQPPVPPPPPPVSAADLPPRQQVKGDGITLTEFVDGRVRVRTTANWNEELDTTYDNCDYYRVAVPVLERQISPERAKLLHEMCVVAPPPPAEVAKPVKRARHGVIAKPTRPATSP